MLAQVREKLIRYVEVLEECFYIFTLSLCLREKRIAVFLVLKKLMDQAEVELL